MGSAYPTYTAPQKACLASYFSYLCTSKSQEQMYQNHTVVAHRLPDSFYTPNDPEGASFEALVDQCAQAFASNKAAAELWALTFFKGAACDQNAFLIGPAEFVVPESPDTAPIPTAGGTAEHCQ